MYHHCHYHCHCHYLYLYLYLYPYLTILYPLYTSQLHPTPLLLAICRSSHLISSSCQPRPVNLHPICQACLPAYEPITPMIPITPRQPLVKAQNSLHVLQQTPRPHILQAHQNLNLSLSLKTLTSQATCLTSHPHSYRLTHVTPLPTYMSAGIQLPRAHQSLPALSPRQDR